MPTLTPDQVDVLAEVRRQHSLGYRDVTRNEIRDVFVARHGLVAGVDKHKRVTELVRLGLLVESPTRRPCRATGNPATPVYDPSLVRPLVAPNVIDVSGTCSGTGDTYYVPDEDMPEAAREIDVDLLAAIGW